MDLANVTNLHMFGFVLLNGGPKLPKVEQLLEKALLALVITTFTHMNFLNNILCFGVP